MEKIIQSLMNDRAQCEHNNEIITSVDSILLLDIWPDQNELEKCWIEGIWTKKCRRCSQIIDYDPRLNELKTAIFELCRVQNGQNLMLGINKRYPKTVNAELLRPEDQSLSETARYEATTPRFSLEKDVILSADTLMDIQNALTKLKYSKTIYEDWGFNTVDPVGKGAIFSFSGLPGTGKTRTAEALAGELGMPFININYGELTSRFMGQTSKNIRLAFEAARDQNALLFFDEADNVLSKRGRNITQSADSESNLSKSTMLKELEQFDGVCVFATNFPEVYDHAVGRRLGFDIFFSLPDLEARKRLWNMHLVPGIPLGFDRLPGIDKIAAASDTLSGGEILKAMRIALPMCLGDDSTAPQLAIEHLEKAISNVIEARKRNSTPLSERQQMSKSMFGS